MFSVQAAKSKHLSEEMKTLLSPTRGAAELRQDGQVKHIHSNFPEIEFPQLSGTMGVLRVCIFSSRKSSVHYTSSSSRVSSVDSAYPTEPCTTHWHRGLG